MFRVAFTTLGLLLFKKQTWKFAEQICLERVLLQLMQRRGVEGFGPPIVLPCTYAPKIGTKGHLGAGPEKTTLTQLDCSRVAFLIGQKRNCQNYGPFLGPLN